VFDPPRPDWIEDIIPSGRSLLVLIDPLRVEPDQAESFLREVTTTRSPPAHPIDPPREIIIPVCYDPALAPDLEPVAARLCLSPDELAALHADAEYTVECLGFSPGFAYLLGLPAPLHLPRRDSPRPRVPAGSVAIAGERSGVYPQSTPGGWHLIGRTPMTLFDPSRDKPALLSVADTVRFRPIPRSEFDRLARHATEHA
jgi:inhibitor of KinA